MKIRRDRHFSRQANEGVIGRYNKRQRFIREDFEERDEILEYFIDNGFEKDDYPAGYVFRDLPFGFIAVYDDESKDVTVYWTDGMDIRGEVDREIIDDIYNAKSFIGKMNDKAVLCRWVGIAMRGIQKARLINGVYVYTNYDGEFVNVDTKRGTIEFMSPYDDGETEKFRITDKNIDLDRI